MFPLSDISQPQKDMRSLESHIHRNTEQMRMPGAGREAERGVAVLGTNSLFHRMSEFWKSVIAAVPTVSDSVLCVSKSHLLSSALTTRTHVHARIHTQRCTHTHTCTHTHHERTQEALEVMDMFSILEVLRV